MTINRGGTRPAPHSFGRVLGEVLLTVAQPHPPGGLRPWLRDTLEGCTPVAIREAATVLEELVANAYHHAAPPYRVRICTSGGGHLLRLAVSDATPRDADVWRLGHGLLIVRGLCRRWGVAADHMAGTDATVDGKSVWAELPVLVPPSAASTR